MKKFMLLAGLLIMSSCQKENTIASQIEASIANDAMGNDLNYKAVQTKEVAQVSYQDAYDVFLTEGDLPKDQSIAEIQKRVEYGIEHSQKTGNTDAYNYLKHMKSRIEDYDAATDKNAVFYKVLKHDYTIINPMFDNKKVNVTGYYIFTAKDSLIGKVSEMQYKDKVKNQIRHDKSPYEAIYYEALQ